MFLYGVAVGATIVGIVCLMVVLIYKKKKIEIDETQMESHNVAMQYIEPQLSLHQAPNGVWFIEAIMGNTAFSRDVDDEMVNEMLLERISRDLNPYRDVIAFDMQRGSGEEFAVEIVRKKTLDG